MFNPELPHFRIWIGKSKPVCRQRMRKERRIEIQFYAGFLRPFHPRPEILLRKPVAIGERPFMDSVAGVKIDAVAAGDTDAIDDLCQAIDKFMK